MRDQLKLALPAQRGSVCNYLAVCRMALLGADMCDLCEAVVAMRSEVKTSADPVTSAALKLVQALRNGPSCCCLSVFATHAHQYKGSFYCFLYRGVSCSLFSRASLQLTICCFKQSKRAGKEAVYAT